METGGGNAVSELRERFEDPPREFSPAPIWWWSGERLDPERLRWQLERFVEGGIFNLIIMNLAPTSPLYGSEADDPPFFSEEWWAIFRSVCQDARRLGVRLWLYDQIGFSGANIQGSIVNERPAFAGHWLERTALTTSDSGTLECPAGGTPVAAAAIPVNEEGTPTGAPIPLSLEGRKVEWEGRGAHRLMLFYSVERGFDYFGAEACRTLIERIHGEYEAHAGDFFGDVIVGSFQDELPSMPTWSEGFAADFEARRGYDLVPHLAALWEEYGDEAKRVRRDYHATRAEIGEETFFEPLFRWHEVRNLTCGFDQQGPARAGHPVETVVHYADYQRTHRWFSAPGSDHHGEAKVHSSLAHLYGRPRTWIEAFHSTGWGGTLEEIFDWLLPWLRAGANLYDPHAVYYSTRGGWWEWAPPSTDWRQPYWSHYEHFSRAVSRLCSVLTLGHHVCDVGVLFPSATVQAGLRLDGATEEAKAAHETYLQLVGSMFWNDTRPGAMDEARRDYDVLDDDSVQRATVEDGALRIGEETYTTVVLPGCDVLEDGTVAKLAEFVEAGGRLVVLGAQPRLSDDAAGRGIEALGALIADDRVPRMDSAADLEKELDAASPVEAPVPTLVRRVGEATVVFVPAAFPRATRTRETEHWFLADYEFDPTSYESPMRVKVRGVVGEPTLWQPFGGEKSRPNSTQTDEGVEVEIPFTDGPGVLLVWSGLNGDESAAKSVAQAESGTEEDLGEVWTVELEPTLDNRWGDFALPAGGGPLPTLRWEFHHRTENGEDGRSEGWHRADLDDSGWALAHATFGPRGLWTGPGAPDTLPKPAIGVEEAAEDMAGWEEAVYSPSRGIYKDKIHRATLGPKGHVPEEFLSFGRVGAGEAVQFRATVTSQEEASLHLAIGAQAARRVWMNGEEIQGEGEGYQSFTSVHLRRGENLLEFRLEAAEDVPDLRAHFAFVASPEEHVRPEMMEAGGEPSKDSVVSYEKTLSVPFVPTKAVLQVTADAPCRLFVNGAEVGRQGGFDPYFERGRARIQPYDVTVHTREGENEISVRVSDLGAPTTALVDALFEGENDRLSLVSDETWTVSRDDASVPLTLRRRQWGDPAHPHLWRRPHPLPAAGWLEAAPNTGGVLSLPVGVPSRERSVEWIRFLIPPGARRMSLEVRGEPEIFLDGEAVPYEAVSGTLTVDLPGYEKPRRVCALRVETEPEFRAGGIFEAPVHFEVGTGAMSLGNWEEQGLAGYSGGVRYLKRVTWEDQANGTRPLLDLGKVRGTAEVRVNGSVAGVRVLSPYVFDLTDLLTSGENELEVLVLGTLGPYLDTQSPTHYVFPGQRTTGLFGPVKLQRAVRGANRISD